MTNRRLHLATLVLAGFAGLFAMFPSAADAEIIDRIIARVNDKIITLHEVEKATTPYLLRNGMDPAVLENETRREKIHRRVLDELINRQLLIAEARKMNLSVTDAQVDRWLAFTRSKQNMSKEQFQSLIREYGMTYEEYRETVRQNLLKVRFTKVKLGRQVSVSDSEVDEMYRERFGPAGATEKHVKVRHILFQPESDKQAKQADARKQAQKVLTELEEGADFKELAKKHSDGPSADKGGLLGTFSKGELNPAFEEVAFELGEGEHSGVVKSKYGFHIIRVDSITENASADVQKRKRMIRQRLQQKKMQEQLEVYVEKLRDKAFVDTNWDE